MSHPVLDPCYESESTPDTVWSTKTQSPHGAETDDKTKHDRKNSICLYGSVLPHSLYILFFSRIKSTYFLYISLFQYFHTMSLIIFSSPTTSR